MYFNTKEGLVISGTVEATKFILGDRTVFDVNDG